MNANPHPNPLPGGRGGLTPDQLDSLYTQLAQAVHAAGSKSELYLAMLSLKLITAADLHIAQHSIVSVLQDLQTHEGARS